MRRAWIWILFALVAGLAAAAAAVADGFRAQFFPVPERLGDTMFSALAEGPDGKLYMGTCNSRGPAHLIRLDAESGRIEDLGNMQAVTGEHDPELIPQSKIHTQLAFDSRERLWFGTHSEEIYSRKGYARWPKGYSGGYLLRYILEADRFENLGMPYPKPVEYPEDISECGLYFISLAIDRANDRLYLVTGDNVFLVVVDTVSGTVMSRHTLLESYPYPASWHRGHANPRDLEVAGDGNVYLFSYEGQLLRYVAACDELEKLDVWIPGSDGEQRNMPYALAIDREGERIYGNGTLKGSLFELTVGPDPTIRDLGIAFEGQEVRRAVVHAITMGQDGRVYYAGDRGVTLFAYDPATGMKRCLGNIRSTNGQSWFMRSAWAACTASSGALWFAGWVETVVGDEKSLRRVAFVRVNLQRPRQSP